MPELRAGPAPRPGTRRRFRRDVTTLRSGRGISLPTALLARRAVDDDAVGTRAVAQLVARCRGPSPRSDRSCRCTPTRPSGSEAWPKRVAGVLTGVGTVPCSLRSSSAARLRNGDSSSARHAKFGRWRPERPRQHPRIRRVRPGASVRVSRCSVRAVGVRDARSVLPDYFQVGHVLLVGESAGGSVCAALKTALQRLEASSLARIRTSPSAALRYRW